MLSTLPKVAVALVLAGATSQAAVLVFDRSADRVAVEADAADSGAAPEPRAVPSLEEAIAKAVGEAVAAAPVPPTSDELIRAEIKPVEVPSQPRTSLGTQRVLTALDAFEDELRFYASLQAAPAMTVPGAEERHDPAGNIAATLVPSIQGAPGSQIGAGGGFGGAWAAAFGGGSGADAASGQVDLGETVNQMAAAAAGFGAGPAAPGIPAATGLSRASPVPLPAGLPLLLVGLAGFAVLRRR